MNARAVAAPNTALVWLRRDLRLSDHTALHHALRQAQHVVLAFVFDTDILDPLWAQGAHADRRLAFIHASLAELDATLRSMGSAVVVAHGRAVDCIPQLAARLRAQDVYVNRDYEPQAIQRDADVARALADLGVRFHSYCDQALLDPETLLTAKGNPYSVFTPYKHAWIKYVQSRKTDILAAHDCADLPRKASALEEPKLPGLKKLGFDPTVLPPGIVAGSRGAHATMLDFMHRIDAYAEARDYPARNGTSGLSVHLRFGTISVREVAREAWQRMATGSQGAAVWLSELIWRDFYFQILFHHPRVVAQAFKREYDRIRWDDAPGFFAAWCEGRTGYPLVDAAMRQLNQTGSMHNRLRMVAASFLTKDLGVDWRLGERYFALKLNDFDLAANNGGWQWAASTGCDAQPYFRIFNPIEQSKKYDAQGDFIRRYLPEIARLCAPAIHAPWLASPLLLDQAGVRLGVDYPMPIVQHSRARIRTLERYAIAKDSPAARTAG